MEQKNLEIHERALAEEGPNHNQEECFVCRLLKERRRKEREEQAKLRKQKKWEEQRKMMIIVGDPEVTAGRGMRSINTFKDLYGIFDSKHNLTTRQRRRPLGQKASEKNMDLKKTIDTNTPNPKVKVKSRQVMPTPKLHGGKYRE